MVLSLDFSIFYGDRGGDRRRDNKYNRDIPITVELNGQTQTASLTSNTLLVTFNGISSATSTIPVS